MPKGNPGIKKPGFIPAEKCIESLKQSAIDRAKLKRENWEKISQENKMVCRTCKTEKNLDLFAKRKNIEYLMWVTECRLCENTRKNKVAQKRANEKGLEWNINQILRSINNRTKKSKLIVDIDLTYLIELFNNQNGVCPYSGRKIQFDINSQERLSLDRKDSTKGYTKDNVVWCCWQANNIKQDLNEDDFKTWITDIYNTLIPK